MAVMSIRISDKKRKLLKIISSLEGKSMSALVEEWIEDHVKKNEKDYAEQLEEREINMIMRLSEPAFMEWNNDADNVYDDL